MALSLVCPKCGSDMTAYERNGITVDQCTGCRGVFLDRGELERLIDAEATYTASGSRDPRASSWPLPPRSHHGDDKRRRERGFLGGLFD